MTQAATPFEQERAFGGVIDVLEAVGAVYAIWGGWAVVAHGEPRFTLDMDILLSPQGLLVDLFVKRLRETGYHVDTAAVFNALAGGFFSVLHLHYHIKTDFYVPPPDSWLYSVLRQRVHLPFGEYRRAAFISTEAAVLTKLRAYADSQSTRHLDDIASIIRVQGSKLNQAHLDVEAAHLGLLGVWRALWETNTPQ